jgi:hypothetical protein
MMKLERQIETYIASLPNQPQLGKRLPLTPIYRLKCVGGAIVKLSGHNRT